jgi:hypothetical protein
MLFMRQLHQIIYFVICIPHSLQNSCRLLPQYELFAFEQWYSNSK